MVSEALPIRVYACVKATMQRNMYAGQGERVGRKERGEEECIGNGGVLVL